jgi:hypothetical protein
MEALGDVQVQALDGSRVTLESLWRERTLVLVFVRHFG